MGKYFSLPDAWSDLKNSLGAAETAKNIFALVGKGVANVAVFGVTEVVPGMLKQAAQNNVKASEAALKRADLSDDERGKLEEVNRKSREQLEKIEKKEREEAERGESNAPNLSPLICQMLVRLDASWPGITSLRLNAAVVA